jgi:hypothetical protein
VRKKDRTEEAIADAKRIAELCWAVDVPTTQERLLRRHDAETLASMRRKWEAKVAADKEAGV